MNLKSIILVLFISLNLSTVAQNLVPNPGFDTYTSCVTTTSEWDLTPPWKVPYDQTGTPDYVNACYANSDKDQWVPENYYGYEEALSGKGYYGLICYYEPNEIREYMGAPLIEKLEAGKTYLIGCFVSCADNFPYSIDQFGLHLSSGRVAGDGEAEAMTDFIPQVSNPDGKFLDETKGWTLVSGRYTATGDEKYITLGNFSNDENTGTQFNSNAEHDSYGYYFVDNVFVLAIEDSASYMDNLNNVLNSAMIDISSTPDLTAAGSEGHGSTYIDLPNQIIKVQLKIDGDFKSIEVIDSDDLTYTGIYIYDEAGSVVAQELPGSGTVSHKFFIEHLKNGDYYIEVFTKERRFKRTKFIIDR